MYLEKKIKINLTEERRFYVESIMNNLNVSYFVLNERKEAWETEQRSVKYLNFRSYLPYL